jgi:hypothetical protein
MIDQQFEADIAATAIAIDLLRTSHDRLLKAAKDVVDCDPDGYRRRSVQFDALRLAIAAAEEPAP